MSMGGMRFTTFDLGGHQQENRFVEAKAELDSLLTDEQVANAPVLIWGTVSRNELPGRPMELFMCSVLKRQGYGEGFRWLAQYIN
ncbi:hypothetical protein KUTeg_017211 [Tegillarca granosa]|uniref:Uncharacterized protein n=1 Tax=Tegillarca granosa TaxID=220873 RepID=A0ABQ9ELJ5_TEGGR|nr:hypothetical protein KUTeg_017211 [Tegillarca granosa]